MPGAGESPVSSSRTRTASEGLVRGARFLSGFLPPDFTSKRGNIFKGPAESLGHDYGGKGARRHAVHPRGARCARNLAPLPVYLVCLGIIAVSRTFRDFIIAMVGFAP